MYYNKRKVTPTNEKTEGGFKYFLIDGYIWLREDQFVIDKKESKTDGEKVNKANVSNKPKKLPNAKPTPRVSTDS